MVYKNLVHESELKTSQWVMRWRLLSEEYRPEIEYTKGSKNLGADVLSRLSKQCDIVNNVDAIVPFVPIDQIINVNCFPLEVG